MNNLSWRVWGCSEMRHESLSTLKLWELVFNVSLYIFTRLDQSKKKIKKSVSWNWTRKKSKKKKRFSKVSGWWNRLNLWLSYCKAWGLYSVNLPLSILVSCSVCRSGSWTSWRPAAGSRPRRSDSSDRPACSECTRHRSTTADASRWVSRCSGRSLTWRWQRQTWRSGLQTTTQRPDDRGEPSPTF